MLLQSTIQNIVVIATHEESDVQRLQTQFCCPQLFLKLAFMERALRCTDVGSHFSLSSIWKEGTRLDKKQIIGAILIAKFAESFHVATVDSQKTLKKVVQKRILIILCPQLLFKRFFIERAL